jgi:uncharacterized damage-inducible protein DinB
MRVGSIKEFTEVWQIESEQTRKLFAALTDASLSRSVIPGDPGTRTVGRLAWHIISSIPEMVSRMGLEVVGPRDGEIVLMSAGAIRRAYDQTSASLLGEVMTHWTDDMLSIEDDMYGERWTRAFSLRALVLHQVHHRGQMTILMRQAGLKVPGLYGPAREDWAQWGMPEPAV